MTQIHGLWWPDDVGTKWRHALKHVQSLEWAIARCASKRTAIQAGGNVGLWPRRLAEVFHRVVSFEPDVISYACLARNVPLSVELRPEAIGDAVALCGLSRASLGSHQIVAGTTIPMTTIDSCALPDVDFLQLDIEGYEWHALAGAVETIRRCRPVIQVELRDFTSRYGKSDGDVVALLAELRYREVARQPGNDVVFGYAG
jgi:FkbM family methyltransferase